MIKDGIYFHEFLSFDNADHDVKPSKRQVSFLSLISGLNHNINKQNLAKFSFATGEDASGPRLILLNYF